MHPLQVSARGHPEEGCGCRVREHSRGAVQCTDNAREMSHLRATAPVPATCLLHSEGPSLRLTAPSLVVKALPFTLAPMLPCCSSAGSLCRREDHPVGAALVWHTTTPDHCSQPPTPVIYCHPACELLTLNPCPHAALLHISWELVQEGVDLKTIQWAQH